MDCARGRHRILLRLWGAVRIECEPNPHANLGLAWILVGFGISYSSSSDFDSYCSSYLCFCLCWLCSCLVVLRCVVLRCVPVNDRERYSINGRVKVESFFLLEDGARLFLYRLRLCFFL